MSSSTSTLRLFKQMLRESEKFADFNFRSYAKRRVRDGFKSAKSLSAEEIKVQTKFARENLEMLKRQTTIGNLFNSGQKLSVEVARQEKKN